MAIKFFNDHALDIVSNDDIKAIAPKAVEALHTLNNKSGAGNDFLGWVDLPTNYDKEEFARIKNAADYIKKNADVLVVIGIGGSTSVQEQLLKHLLLQTTMHLRKIHLTFTLLVILSAHLLSTKSYQSARAKIFALM